ncbi:MAG TPA: site-2 protease family protein [Terriglobales bacterium]|jgi:membrane-associated protease RseP (regulator of RpoE activity)|nr:site-2 protease family protein [Terriglobales bacterium]
MSDSISAVSSTTDFYRPMPVYVVERRPQRYWLHILLLIATIFTTLVVGARMEFNFLHNQAAFAVGDEFVPFFPIEWALAHPSRLLLGIPFSGTLLLILMAHEMGHYLYCRHYRVYATLPFFIPAPTLIGTLGAVIRIRSPIRTRAALFDIGIAGPIAGFVVSVITLPIALGMSKPMPLGIGSSALQFGYPLIFEMVHRGLTAALPGYQLAGLPLSRVYMHPIAIAAWVGMFATALNLLPTGQLDGGHIVYALWPRAHRYISWITVIALVFLSYWYVGWRLWAGLITVMNIITWRQRQAPDYPELRGVRWGIALLGLLMLIVTLAPAPLRSAVLDGMR